MKEKNVGVKRKAIGRKLRFEVFKRDSFTCQYCGRKAPDVVLEIDHIHPVSKGGKNDIMNLVTSCLDCNRGKGANKLSEQTTVERQRAQAELLQERREQIKMMAEWQIGLASIENEAVNAVNSLFEELTNGRFSISDEFLNKKVKELIKQYSLQSVLIAMRSGFDTYNDPKAVLNKLSGICYFQANPVIAELFRERNSFVKELRKTIVDPENINERHIKSWLSFIEQSYSLDEARESVQFVLANMCSDADWEYVLDLMKECVENIRAAQQDYECYQRELQTRGDNNEG